MPYKNGKVYHETVNGKKYGASNLDVAKALSTTTLDVAKLCQHSNINMWAMFKPIPHDTPLPFTDEFRKSKSWGLVPYVASANSIPTEAGTGGWAAAPQWSYQGASGWYVLDDFVSENEGMGYAPSAPPVVRSVMGVSGKKLNVTLYFEGNYDNGGIRPYAMKIVNVTADDDLMAGLYPGVVIFKRVEGGAVAYTPMRIITQGNKIGPNTTRVDMSYSFGSLGTGEFVAFPILSKTAYIGGSALSGVTENVCFVHGGMYIINTYDNIVGTELFTRRYVGDDYFSYIGISYQTEQYEGMPRYWWMFTTTGTNNYLTLRPQSELINLEGRDGRIMATLTLKNVGGSYGIGDYSPIAGRKDSNGNIEDITSQSEFSSLYRDYKYTLCSWADVDGARLNLVLLFKAHSGAWHGDGRWYMTFLRGLAIINEAGETLWSETGSQGRWLSHTVQKEAVNGNITSTGVGIRKIRFGNIVADNGSYNEAKGVYLMLFGVGNESAGWTVNNYDCIIYCADQTHELQFNIANIDGIQKLPVTTSMYIDITVDTQNTVQDLT